MLIKRIKAKNFKTYLDLDLDLNVSADKPIILIGGKNGGGKTTLFEAVYHALYGLNINSSKHFAQLLNAGALGQEEEKITLELHFSGKVLNEEQQYVLTRIYMLNPSQKPVESVKLNMNGSIFQYGTASTPSQKAIQEAQVNKIIKANLPQELSRYFLFDAMEAGDLLKEDQLNTVIKENIENVMGFNKYMQMATASENILQQYTAQKLQVEKEKQEYLALVEEKKQKDQAHKILNQEWELALQYAVANKELYDNLKAGLNEEKTIKNKIEQIEIQVQNTQQKEIKYREDTDKFSKDLETNICLPKLLESIKSEVNLILKSKKEQEEQQSSNIQPKQIEAISKSVVMYLQENKLLHNEISISELIDYVIASSQNTSIQDKYNFLEFSEVKALEGLLSMSSFNPFPVINQQKMDLEIAIHQTEQLENQIHHLKAQITGKDYNVLKAYEENEQNTKNLQNKIGETQNEITKIDNKLHQFDIQSSQEPDPKYDALLKLKPFFEDVGNKLLLAKKEQIELKMKQDLNTNLAAYKDVISKVELSEKLSNLTFKIYHTSGNEIYLNQLNTASKQVVVQVLLKALHEFGDYDPPVMIDTVMGVLDETSRATVLENYFPELSHQTILLSSDSEIRVSKDLDKIKAFVAKAYTLNRDIQKQCTSITEGYFGIQLND